ncbi:hypothetical protein ACGF3L_41265, partial [Streptomyces parvus]
MTADPLVRPAGMFTLQSGAVVGVGHGIPRVRHAAEVRALADRAGSGEAGESPMSKRPWTAPWSSSPWTPKWGICCPVT